MGHERVARIADHLITGRPRLEVAAMLHGDIVELADWGQRMTEKHPETEVLHWHHQDPEWDCYSGALGHAGHLRCDEDNAEKGSMLCALAFFFEHFAHDRLLNEFPKPDDPIGTPEKLPLLEKFSSDELTSVHYLRWLAVLMGDLHMPLHWLRDHDYGAKVNLVWEDQVYTMLEFWEEYLPKNLTGTEIKGKEMLDQEYQERQELWHDKSPIELFRDWAREAAMLVCQDVYERIEINHKDGSRTIDDPFELNKELYQSWVNMADNFLYEGGERLAFILLDLIEHKRHKAAHKEGRGRIHPRHTKRTWWKKAGQNVIIAFVVVPLWLVALRWHAWSSGKVLHRTN